LIFSSKIQISYGYLSFSRVDVLGINHGTLDTDIHCKG